MLQPEQPLFRVYQAQKPLVSLLTQMSRKIEVKEHNSVKSHHVKRSIAECLVRRLLAEWTVQGVAIRMLPPAEGLKRLQFLPSILKRERESYMEQKDGLPSAELPGLSFMLDGRRVWCGAEAAKWLREGQPSL